MVKMEEELKKICTKFFDQAIQNAFKRDQERANNDPENAWGVVHQLNLCKQYRQTENEIIKTVPEYQNPADGLKKLGLPVKPILQKIDNEIGHYLKQFVAGQTQYHLFDTKLKRKILYYEIAPDEHNNCFHVLDELSDYLRKQNISVSFCGYDRINIGQKSNYNGNNDVLLMVFQDQKSGKFRINLGFDDDTDPYTPNFVPTDLVSREQIHFVQNVLGKIDQFFSQRNCTEKDALR